MKIKTFPCESEALPAFDCPECGKALEFAPDENGRPAATCCGVWVVSRFTVLDETGEVGRELWALMQNECDKGKHDWKTVVDADYKPTGKACPWCGAVIPNRILAKVDGDTDLDLVYTMATGKECE